MMRRLNFGIAKLPRAERLIGFTIPARGKFYVGDHDEVWLVNIGWRVSAKVTDEAPYEFVGKRNDFLGLVFQGLAANAPILRAGGSEISYQFEPSKDFVTVDYTRKGHRGKIEFRTFSGDWFAASLSADGKFLVLAEPCEIALYRVA